jgi:cytochrome c oxidase subunit IV
MADTHDASKGDPVFRAYITVFGLLAFCTLLSFVVLKIFGHGSVTGASIIMMVAVIKATAVALIFMHLKWDWGKLYFLIVPVFVLGVTMMMVLLPDLVFAWSH